MCGRMRPKMTPAIAEAFGIRLADVDHDVKSFEEFEARPTTLFPVIRVRDGKREAVTMRWGLIPGWARGVAKPGISTFNARAETVATAPTYRTAWRRGQRCIVPVACFFEPHVDDRRAKTTYRITIKGRAWFGLAGLWDESRTDDGKVITSCTLITMEASPKMAEIHNEKKRQPVILRAEDHDAWLEGTVDEARALIRHYPDELIEAEAVIAGRFSGVEQPPDLFDEPK